MESSNTKLLLELTDAVLAMDKQRATDAALKALQSGMDANEAVSMGLVPGINEAGRRYATGEFFIPELLLCSDTMYAALDVLTPHFVGSDDQVGVRCVIGTVKGDIHDLGKTLVRTMLQLSGFDVVDLGVDVSASAFIEAMEETGSRLLCLSALMTTTTAQMGSVVDLLVDSGLRDRVKVLVGGAAVSWTFAERIGADGYADNAVSAAQVASAWFVTK